MSVSVDPDSNEVIVTCLEGICSLENEEGTVEIMAGQKASITNFSEPPQSEFMTEEEINEWLEENPEATMVLNAMSATVDEIPSSTTEPEGEEDDVTTGGGGVVAAATSTYTPKPTTTFPAKATSTHTPTHTHTHTPTKTNTPTPSNTVPGGTIPTYTTSP